MTDIDPGRPPAAGYKPNRTPAILLVVAGVISFLLLAVWLIGVPGNLMRRAAQKALQKQETAIDLGTVVTRVRELGRLETAAMRVMHMSKTTQSYGVVPDSIAGDSLTFMAVGDVIAGIDLAAIRQEDVRIERDRTLVVTLPPPQLLISRVDNRQSRVVDRDTGMLRKADLHLESRARAESEKSIRKEAVVRGILPLAAKNAETKLGSFLKTIGFERVRFVQRGADSDNL